MSRKPSRLLLLLATLALLPGAAFAHPGHDVGFAGGLAHPFLGLDHLLAMLLVGVWAVLHARRVWLAPTVFVSLLAVGALLGQNGITLPQLEPLVAASVIALGLMLTLARGPALPAALALIGGFALCHGMAHGSEIGAGGAALAGILLGSAALHGAGMALAHFALRGRQLWAARIGQASALVGSGLLLSTLF